MSILSLYYITYTLCYILYNIYFILYNMISQLKRSDFVHLTDPHLTCLPTTPCSGCRYMTDASAALIVCLLIFALPSRRPSLTHSGPGQCLMITVNDFCNIRLFVYIIPCYSLYIIIMSRSCRHGISCLHYCVLFSLYYYYYVPFMSSWYLMLNRKRSNGRSDGDSSSSNNITSNVNT